MACGITGHIFTVTFLQNEDSKEGRREHGEVKEDKKNCNTQQSVKSLLLSIWLLNSHNLFQCFLGESRSCWICVPDVQLLDLIPSCSVSAIPQFHAPIPMLGANLKEKCFEVNLISFWKVLLCLSALTSAPWAGPEASITPGSLCERHEQQWGIFESTY